MDGLLVVDKPSGPTSHDVVARLRRLLGERRIGHTGTLDPAATGVLALVVGRATRLARFLSASDKAYDAVVRLGFATDTYDADGTAAGAPFSGPRPTREAVTAALEGLRGSYLQQPPAYSAKKIDGRRSYARAREAARSGGNGVQNVHSDPSPVQPSPAQLPAPAAVTVRTLDLLQMNGDLVTLRVEASAGFYVRTLAHEIGQRLGCGAHLAALRRTRSGDVTLDEALPLDALERDPAGAALAIVPLSRMLPGLAAVHLTIDGVRHALHGRDSAPSDIDRGVGSLLTDSPFVRLLAPGGELVAIGSPAGRSGLLHPTVVLM